MTDVLLHVLHTVPVVCAYVAIGGPLLGFVLRVFIVDRDPVARAGARLFFFGCAATHLLLLWVLISVALPVWLHATMAAVCTAQAVGAPLFVRAAWRAWRAELIR